MAKYRGKYQDKTRGKYVSKAFESEHSDAKQNSIFARSVNCFLERRGCLIFSHPEIENEMGEFSNHAYHIGGATVGVQERNWDKRYFKLCRKGYGNESSASPYYTRIKLVSNDCLDDIVQKVLKEFPSLEEIDFSSHG